MSNAQLFEHNGYVHLKGFLDELNCQELTTELKRLVAEKKTVKDDSMSFIRSHTWNSNL
jgi:hypothetical protein